MPGAGVEPARNHTCCELFGAQFGAQISDTIARIFQGVDPGPEMDASIRSMNRSRLSISPLVPHLLPGLELSRSDPVSREVPFVQAQDFFLCHFSKLLPVRGIQTFLREGYDPFKCGLPAESATYDLADNVADLVSVLQLEGIGLAQ